MRPLHDRSRVAAVSLVKTDWVRLIENRGNVLFSPPGRCDKESPHAGKNDQPIGKTFETS